VWIVQVVGDTFFTSETQQRAIDDAWREGHSGRLDGIAGKLLVEQGSIYEALTRVVEKYSADLLVVGTGGRSRIGKLFLGSAAESIFRQAPCPVLTVGPRNDADTPSEGPDKILFCTGFSKHSIAAGKLALRLAEPQGRNFSCSMSDQKLRLLATNTLAMQARDCSRLFRPTRNLRRRRKHLWNSVLRQIASSRLQTSNVLT
jgi:hypothetical protein